MFRSYLSIALRHLITQKLYSAINVFGLAIGLTCCLLIGLFVVDELSYDKHYRDADRIYRISLNLLPANGGPGYFPAANVPAVAPLLEQDFPQIEQIARVTDGAALLRRGANAFYEERFRYADGSFFDIFDFEWLRGDSTNALANPMSVVLTESTAKKYFGADDPVGQTLLLENEWPLTVTGVIRDLPDNTHLSADAVASMDALARSQRNDAILESWTIGMFHTYFRLQAGADIADLQSELPRFLERRVGPEASARSSETVTKLTDIHLRSDRLGELTTPGSMTIVYTLGAVGLCILLIACINFMNLSTARSSQRAREVGMRKAMGAARGQIVRQFLGESILLAAIAMLIGLALLELSLPAINAFSGKTLDLDYLTEPPVLAGLMAGALFLGLLAGVYPAFYLSAFDPARVLKGDITRGSAGASFRNALVVAQFSIAVALVIATAIVYSQLRFARNIELGFNKDQVLIVSGTPSHRLGPQWPTLKEQLLAHPAITHVSASNLVPAGQNRTAIFARAEGSPDGRLLPVMMADHDFIETYDIVLVAGRKFSKDRASDQLVQPDENDPQTAGSFILNELAARQFGWTPDEAIDKWFEVTFPSMRLPLSSRGPVIGVVRNTYFYSLRSPLDPIVYFVPPETNPLARAQASVRVSTDDLAATLEFIDAKWAEIYPDQPINRRFLDTDFDAQYRSDRQLGQLFGYFSGLAIVIACLGLFGLAAFTTERRTKEIGIRKVMGGTVPDIVLLLTKEFSKLVLIANLVAWPSAYVLMQLWLENFAYRIEIGPFVFIGSGLIALLIASLTVGAVAAKAASAKPIRSLRYE